MELGMDTPRKTGKDPPVIHPYQFTHEAQARVVNSLFLAQEFSIGINKGKADLILSIDSKGKDIFAFRVRKRNRFYMAAIGQ